MAKPKRGRSTAAIDDHVGARIRERRIMLLEIARNFAEIRNEKHQEAVSQLARALASR